MRCKWLLDNEGDIKSLRGENYVVDYMNKTDAYLIKCVILRQLGIAVLWLQIQAPTAESWVWILVTVLFCLPCCHEFRDLKVMGEREGWSNVQMMSVGTVITRVMLDQREREDYALLNEEQIVYIFFVINALKKNLYIILFFTF